jgi:replicative DNA helicase
VKKIMMGGFDFDVDDDDGDDIFDRKMHVQPNANELFPTGWQTVDRWNSGQDEGRGGFEPGTTTYLVGPPNSGKSLFLWSIGYNTWYYGANVLGVSLEMSSHKIAKRIGSNAFGVDIGHYAKFASDELKFDEAVKKFKGEQNDGMLDLNMRGHMRIKRFASATVGDIEKLIDRIEDRYGYKINVLVLDYATELSNSSGLVGDKMYSYHKENASEICALGVSRNIAMITAHQLHVRYKYADDVSLQMLAESTGITQRPDTFLGIIHSDQQRVEKKFSLKLLKGRDTGQVEYRTNFDIDWNHMRLTAKNDIVDPAVVM